MKSSIFSLAKFIQRQKEWSSKTFGGSGRYKGVVAHIRKELIEIEENPADLMEWIDVIILALDGAWRTGHTPDEIIETLQKKQDINFSREWQKPGKANEPTEHKRAV